MLALSSTDTPQGDNLRSWISILERHRTPSVPDLSRYGLFVRLFSSLSARRKLCLLSIAYNIGIKRPAYIHNVISPLPFTDHYLPPVLDFWTERQVIMKLIDGLSALLCFVEFSGWRDMFWEGLISKQIQSLQLLIDDDIDRVQSHIEFARLESSSPFSTRSFSVLCLVQSTCGVHSSSPSRLLLLSVTRYSYEILTRILSLVSDNSVTRDEHDLMLGRKKMPTENLNRSSLLSCSFPLYVLSFHTSSVSFTRTL